MNQTKQCPQCRNILDVSAFSWDKEGKICNGCASFNEEWGILFLKEQNKKKKTSYQNWKLSEQTKETKKCNNPVPSGMYSKDELKEIHFDCENCGKEVICIKLKGEKEKWVHGHFAVVPVIDK